jgi:Sugar (and other) transporter
MLRSVVPESIDWFAEGWLSIPIQLARPIGGVLFGPIGDRLGRAHTLRLSIFVMAVPTTLIAFLPTHAQAGFLAPALLVVLRLAQGLSVGGEYIGSCCYLVEAAPAERRSPGTSGDAAPGPAGCRPRLAFRYRRLHAFRLDADLPDAYRQAAGTTCPADQHALHGHPDCDDAGCRYARRSIRLQDRSCCGNSRDRRAGLPTIRLDRLRHRDRGERGVDDLCAHQRLYSGGDTSGDGGHVPGAVAFQWHGHRLQPYAGALRWHRFPWSPPGSSNQRVN